MTFLPHLRRRVLASTLAATVALTALAGCASPSPGDEPSGAAAALLPTAEGSTDYPLTLDSPFGETVLEQRPERVAIVTASTVDTDALIAIGGTPVFAPSTIERNPWLDPDAIAGIETLWESNAGAEVSAEAVAASDPDLIVALYAYDSFDRARFEQLSRIAPVLYAEGGELSWQETTQRLAESVDLSAESDRVIASTERLVSDSRDEHPGFAGRTAAHVIVYEEDYGAAYVSAPGTDTATLFEQLGFDLPDNAARFESDEAISDELIGLIDADFLLVSTFEDGSADYFVESPLFRAVPAVAEGRTVIDPADQKTGINSFAWGLNVQSAISVPWLIDRLAGFGEQALQASEQ
jgi:iron complex transport system substrate-binding protein